MRLSILLIITGFILFQKIDNQILVNDGPILANVTDTLECLTDEMQAQFLARDPSLALRQDAIEKDAYHFFSAKNKNGAESALLADYTLPIVFHIIHQNGLENISDAEVIQAVEWLNDAYANINYYDQGVGVDTKIEFCLAKQDPDGNATTGILRVQSPLTDLTTGTDAQLKNLSRYDPYRYINVWLVKNVGGAGGYATLPGSHGSPSDGIVMLAEKLQNVGSAHSTLVHEIGHYLGLYHTFQGGCTNNDCLLDGDQVCDTPPDGSTAAPPYCTASINSCNTDTNSGFATDQDDLIWDYLDYGNYACRAGFTQGQADRMHYFIDHVRFSLLNTFGCVDPCPNPYTASFVADQTSIVMGETVNFVNTSTGGTAYEWQLNGVPFSNGTNASYTFSTGSGDMEISLVATNGDPNCTEIYTVVIEVACPAEASYQPGSLATIPGGTIDFTNTSVNGAAFQWLIDGVPFSTATDATYTFPSLGNYAITLVAEDITGACQDEYTLIVQVSCVYANFSASSFFPAPGDMVSFTNNSLGATSFTWTVNGAVESTATDFSYSFPNEGAFIVCLEAVDGNCSDQFCQQVFVFVDDTGECTGTYLKALGNAGEAELSQALVVAPDGNFIVGGQRENTSLLMMVNPAGEIIWSRTFDFTNGADFIFEIMLDSDGKLIGTGRDELNSNTLNYVFKYDYQNDVVDWVRLMPDPAFTRLEILLEKSPGDNYFVLGMAADNNFFAELDRNTGAVVNMRQFDFGNTDHFLGGLIHNGEIYTCGVQRNGGLTAIRASMTKLDFSGNQQWTRFYFNNLNQPARTYFYENLIEFDTIVAYGRGDLTGSSFTDVEILLLKTDLNGSFYWAKRYDIIGSNAEFNGSILPLPDGYILQGTHVVDATGIGAYYFIRVNKAGDIIWAKSIANVAADWGKYAVVHNGFIYFSGRSTELDNTGDILWGKMSLDGEVAGPGCEYISDLNVAVNPVSQQYDGQHLLTPLNANFPLNPTAETATDIQLDNNDLPTCECNVFSGDCEETYVTAFGTADTEQGRRIVPVPGGAIIGGSKNDSLAIAFVTSSGTLVWQRTFNFATYTERLYDLILDSQGFLVGAGVTDPDPVTSNRTPFVFKYDYQNDNLLWSSEMTFTTANISGFTTVVENPQNGNYLLTGQSGSGITGCDGYLVEVDKNSGLKIFEKKYDLGSCETFSKAIVLNNSLYTTGRHNFAGGGTNRMRGAITELDFSGNQIWSRLYIIGVNTAARLYTNDMLHENGGLYVIGQGDPQGTSPSNVTIQFFNTDLNGNILWAKEFDVTGAINERTTRLFSTPDGFLILGNYEAASNDIFIIKTDKLGNLLWSKGYGSGGDEFAYDMFFLNGQIYVVGETSSFGSGGADFLLIKLGLNGNLQDSDCNFETAINVTESDYNNPYDGSHPLSVGGINTNIQTTGATPQQTPLTEEQLCYTPCADTCANGAPLHEVPDAVLQFIQAECGNGNLLLSVQVCNADSFFLPGGTPISFYDENPTTGPANLLLTVALPGPVQPGACEVFQLEVTLPINQTIFAVVNDNGTTPTPFDLFLDFPNTQTLECDFSNNIGSFEMNYAAPPLDLGPDVSACHFSVVPFDAGQGFASYHWSDGSLEQTFTAWEPGTYWVEVTDSCGGMQSDTVIVTLDPSSVLDIGADTVVICQGDSALLSINGFDHYQWTSGTGLDCDTCATVFASPDSSTCYILVANSSDGCFSEDTVCITVVPATATTDTMEFCSGDTVVIFGNPVNTPGNYSATFQGQNGCDSIHTITLVETNDTVLVNENQSICQGDSLLFFGNWLSATGVYENFDSMGACVVHSVLDLSVLDTFFTTENITVCQGDSADIFGVATMLAGVYEMAFQAINGCDSTHRILLSVLDTVSTSDTITICENEMADIFGTLTNVPGTYSQTFQAFNSCDSTHFITLVVNDTVLTTESVSICFGDSALIFGNWEMQPGVFFQAYPMASGCDSTHTITLTVGSELLLAFETMEGCSGTDDGGVSVLATGGVLPLIYQWNVAGQTGNSIENLPPGNYSVTVTDANGCTAEGGAQLDGAITLDLQMDIADASCFGFADGSLSVAANLPDLLYSFDGIIYQPGTNWANMPAGSYTLFVQNEDGCEWEFPVEIGQPGQVFVTLPADVTIELGETITIQANTVQDSLLFAWMPPLWLNCDDCPDPAASPETTTLYTVTVFDQNDCSDSDSILVTVEFLPNVFVPNAFSPNGDGINDVFFINAKGVVEVQFLQIFDRWGELVFEGSNFPPNDPFFGWDGTFKGKKMNPAVFAWYAELVFLDGKKRTFKGDLTLLR
ncbi:MAG: gliding motility-associated C-terminal domain-containing protein [Saprospiraceae bacterium]|nr:gliding motility-associated C-terminal domain-containing protein [Saprospiraceae bacterium]